jgi:hypothetical protein
MLAKGFTVLALSFSALASPTVLKPRASSSIADLALQKVLSDAAPIFGYYSKNDTKFSTWMSKYPDSTKLVHSGYPKSSAFLSKSLSVLEDNLQRSVRQDTSDHLLISKQ